MSIETWKDEFYARATETLQLDSMHSSEVILHSLTKWRGLTGENLDKHGLFAFRSLIKNKHDNATQFFVDVSTCSLCMLARRGCNECLITQAGLDPCKDQRGPFEYFLETGSPNGMICVLEHVLEYFKDNEVDDIILQPVPETPEAVTTHV